MELDKYFKMVINSLDFVSKSYDEQVSALPSFVDVPEEVVSDFENAFLLLPQLIEAQYFSFEAVASIIRLFNWVQWSIRNVGLDDLELFKSSDEWNKVRELSKIAFALCEKPNPTG